MKRRIRIDQPFYGGGWPAYFAASSKTLVERSEYRRQKYLKLGCTQLDPPYKPSDQKRILAEWCDFFRGPSPVRDLGLFSRTPEELFESICLGGQIQQLHVKWGPVRDLSPVSNLQCLEGLHLGTTGVTDLSPLAALPGLTHLSLDNLKHVYDFSDLANVSQLQYLSIEGYPQGPQKIRVKDLRFLRELTSLRALRIGYVIIEEFDVDALCSLQNLEYLSLPDVGRTESERLTLHAAAIRQQLPHLRYGNVST